MALTCSKGVISLEEVIVYTTENCGGCELVTSFLDRNDVAYTEKNVSKDPDSMDQVKELGVMSFPITVVDGEVLAVGFEYEELSSLI